MGTGASQLESRNLDEAALEEGRISATSPLRIHEILQGNFIDIVGKIGVSLKFKNLEELKCCFTYPNLIKLVSENSDQECVTSKLNVILTDGTSILGLGNIGPIPGLAVMEAKSMMFKLLGNVNVVPVCINARKTPEKTIEAILDLIHLYRAVNL